MDWARWFERGRKAAADDGEAGQAMVEFVIIFPLQLVVTVCLMQFALLVVGRIAIDHAAWCAARAALVACQPGGQDPQAEAERAAEEFLIPVSGRKGAIHAPLQFPGWGSMDRSGAAQTKTRVTVLNVANLKTADHVGVTVEHDFLLAVPIANMMFVFAEYRFVWFTGTTGNQWDSRAKTALYDSPHIVLESSAWIPKPWQDPDQ